MKQSVEHFSPINLLAMLTIIGCCSFCDGSVIVQGPSLNALQSTPFALQAHASYTPTPVEYNSGVFSWFVGAHSAPPTDNSAYSISGLRAGKQTLEPLITQQVNFRSLLTVQANQPNPLWGATIAFLDTLGANPVVVSQSDLSTIFVINSMSVDIPHNTSTMYYTSLATEAGPPTILALKTLNNIRSEAPAALSAPSVIAYAAAPPGGVFGDTGSFLGFSAFIMTQAITSQDTQNGKTAQDAPTVLALGNLQSNPLSTNSPQFAIGSPIIALGNNPTLATDPFLDKVYLGVEVTGNSAPTDGVQSVLVTDITLRSGSLTMGDSKPLIDSALVGANNIIAAQASNAHFVIYQLRTMRTSTGLPYLLVNGGDATNATTAASLFALPILNNSGALASISSPPQTEYAVINGIPFAMSRKFVTPPLNANDIYTNDSSAAQVGGGPLPAPITDIVVAGDAVFVSTALTLNGQAPGVWHSQALYSATGTILRWTPWRRAGGAQAAVATYGLSYDQYTGLLLLLTGSSDSTVQTIRTNAWSQTGTLAMLATQLIGYEAKQSNAGGVQGIVNYERSSTYPALTFFTGYQSLLIAQTDELVNPGEGGQYIQPRLQYPSGFTSSDGSFSSFSSAPNYSWCSCTGGALSNIGACVTAAIAENGPYGWFIVAGTGGIAVLTNPNGSGWCTSSGGLGENFAQLRSTMSWRQLPLIAQGQPINGIRKIVYNSNQVYILADSGLYRITPTAELFSSTVAQEVTVLATTRSFPSGNTIQCADCFIAGPLALVATNAGLFRSGNNAVTSTAASPEDMRWTAVPLPYSPGPICMLYTIGPVAHTEDAGYDANIWTLSAAVSLHQSKLFRLTMSHTGTITEESVQLFPDEIIAQQNGYFLSFSNYHNSVATDGALLAFSRSKYLTLPGFARIYPPSWYKWPANNISTTQSSGELGFSAVSAQSGISPIAVHGLQTGSASGVWLAPGNFGVISNE